MNDIVELTEESDESLVKILVRISNIEHARTSFEFEPGCSRLSMMNGTILYIAEDYNHVSNLLLGESK